jgi:hypothetical protein
MWIQYRERGTVSYLYKRGLLTCLCNSHHYYTEIEVFEMEETLKLNVVEEAIEKFKEENPSLVLQVEFAKESLKKVGEALLQMWEKVKEFFSGLWKSIRTTYDKMKPLIEYYEGMNKRKNYRQSLHSFLRTDHYQRNNTFCHSNIYHSSGRNKGYRRK